MRSAHIVLMCVVAACLYGILHDQVTARVCVEYFTVAHDPTVIPTDDPTLLGLGWGILATWWVGLMLGVVLAVAARAGRRPPRTARSLVRPLLQLLAVMAVFALIAGVVGYAMGVNETVVVIQPGSRFAEAIPREKWPAFQACAFAHSMSYWVGFVGGGIQIAIVWVSRKWIRSKESPRINTNKHG